MDLRRRYFVNNPDTNNDIEVLKETVLGQSQPLFSVIMPVYNQRDIIRRNVQAVLDNTSGAEFELIIILDACSDDTEDQLRDLDLDRSLLVRVLVLKSRVPMFETACDNLGFFCARGRYLIEVQADIEITERGYNQRLLAPMLTVPAMIGISGRCCHCWAPTSNADRVGRIQGNEDMSHVPRNAFFIGETANRGPLMFDSAKSATSTSATFSSKTATTTCLNAPTFNAAFCAAMSLLGSIRRWLTAARASRGTPLTSKCGHRNERNMSANRAFSFARPIRQNEPFAHI